MKFIKELYEDGLVEQHLEEDAWADIRRRRLERADRDRSVALYGYLVGIENAKRAIQFIEMAEQNKSVPKNYVEAYLPLIELIDDIVDSGPTGVTLLRQLHKRLKKKR